MYAWTNQYIPLVLSRKDRILEEYGDGFKEKELLSFKAIIESEGSQGIIAEIGSGSGQHIISLAQKNPTKLCIGFELRYKRAFRTIEKAGELGISNLIMVRGDAKKMGEVFQPLSLDQLYIHFPDPWEKRRWRKNRLLLQERFMELVIGLMKNNALFSFRSDHQEYYQSACKYLTQFSALELQHSTRDLVAETGEDFEPSSEFEALFVSQKLPIGSSVWRRVNR